MRYLDLIWTCLILACFLGGLIWVWVCLIQNTLQRRRDREAGKQQARDARAKILADGKVEGPKGRFVWKNWSRKWVNYANSIPAPKAQSRHFMQIQELPKPPNIIKDD
jgi:hypothetical protein